MTTTTNTPALADLPAGHPVVVTWGSGIPGVNVGGRDKPLPAYNADGRAIVYDPNGSAYLRPTIVSVPDLTDLAPDVLLDAAKVAERRADDLAHRATAAVGVIRELTTDETMELVTAARRARIEAWAWTVIAELVREGRDLTGRAYDYLTGWRSA